MAENSAIEWTDHTFNPWHGCVRVSEACRHCYAETFAKRFGVEWGPQAQRRFFGEKHWQEPLKWNEKARKAGERHRVFCASMADVFEQLPEGHPDTEAMAEARMHLWFLIQATPHLDWLLLTKRPENILSMVLTIWREGHWPANAWVGTTCETQADADKRIPHLLQVPAPVRFLSCEPLLGPIDLKRFVGFQHEDELGITNPDQSLPEAQWLGFHDPWVAGVNWVICGGESGPGARPMHPDWARSLRDQCQAAKVAFHFKQWGEFGPVFEPPYPNLVIAGDTIIGMTRLGKKSAGRLLDWRTWDEFPQSAR